MSFEHLFAKVQSMCHLVGIYLAILENAHVKDLSDLMRGGMLRALKKMGWFFFLMQRSVFRGSVRSPFLRRSTPLDAF